MKNILRRKKTDIYNKIPIKARISYGRILYDSYNKFLVKKAKAKKKQASGKNGIYYYEMGNPKNQTIIFLHGFGDSKESYLRHASALRNNYHIIIPDLPGFGENPRQEKELHSTEHLAASFHQLVSEKGLSSFHLLGNSLGGAVAMDYVFQNKSLIKTLILSASAGFYNEKVPSIYGLYLNGTIPFQVKNPKEHKEMLEYVFHKPPFIPSPVRDFLAEQSIQNHDWYGKVFRDLMGDISPQTSLESKIEASYNNKVKQIEAPTLLIWGEKDKIFPCEFAKIANNNIRNSTLKIIPDVGHVPRFENYDLFMSHLKKWLKENH